MFLEEPRACWRTDLIKQSHEHQGAIKFKLWISINHVVNSVHYSENSSPMFSFFLHGRKREDMVD